MLQKLKSFLSNDAFFMALLLVLVGITSFGLGRQSVLVTVVSEPAVGNVAAALSPSGASGVVFTDAPPAPAAVLQASTTSSSVKQPATAQSVVASRTGTKYHLPTCPGAKQIKEGNKLTFESVALARAAGYTPAANCPGLE